MGDIHPCMALIDGLHSTIHYLTYQEFTVACHNGSVRRAGMAIGRSAFMIYVYSPAPPTYSAVYRWVGLGVGDGLPMVI